MMVENDLSFFVIMHRHDVFECGSVFKFGYDFCEHLFHLPDVFGCRVFGLFVALNCLCSKPQDDCSHGTVQFPVKVIEVSKGYVRSVTDRLLNVLVFFDLGFRRAETYEYKPKE